MTVYVDTANIPATVGRIKSRWSHLTADTEPELHAFAARLGLRRSWFQTCKRPCGKGPCVHWHYDLTEQRRTVAVQLGAEQVDMRKLGEIIRARRAAQDGGTQ